VLNWPKIVQKEVKYTIVETGQELVENGLELDKNGQ
jgi:hypothetical protein